MCNHQKLVSIIMPYSLHINTMSVDPTNIEKADPVLEGGSSFSMLHIIVGAILVGAIVYFFIKRKSSPYTYKKTAKAKVSAVVKKKTILFTGPADSGKTTMVHQVSFLLLL